MKRFTVLFSGCFLLLVNSLVAQTESTTTTTTTSSEKKSGLPSPKDYDRWSAGLFLGNTFFFSDVLEDSKNNNAFKSMPIAPAFGLQVSYQMSHSVALRASGVYATFKAGPSKERLEISNKVFINPEVEYESPVIEAALDAVYTFGNISHLQRNKNFHFFVSLGVGLFSFDGETTAAKDETFDTNGDGTADVTVSEGDKLVETGAVTEMMIPMGLGFKYRLGKIDLGLSYDYRHTFTDKVDGLNKPETEYDHYAMLRLGVNYTFGNKNKAMEWVNPMEVVYNDIADLKEKVDILSGDKDKDGVSDMFDKDNSTAEGTKVYGDGTSIDTDGDGVSDGADGDPFSLKGAKVDANGVEIDTDGDGVADSRDLEPATEKGKMVNFQGMTIKADGKDGAVYLPSVFFGTNGSSVSSAQRDRILVVAKAMKANPEMKVMVTGHADNTASEKYNETLALKRADAVKDHLVKVYGIDAARISTES